MVVTRTYDLRIPQGVTWECVIPVLKADGTLLTNLTGYTARAQVRGHFGDPASLHEWSTAAGNLELADGFVTLGVAPSTSSSWPWRFGRWDLEVTDPDGAVTRIMQGAVFVNPEVTR